MKLQYFVPVKVLIFVGLGAANAFASDCRQIDILSKAQADKAVHDSYRGSAIDAKFFQRQTVREAERLMTPLLCTAARRLAFVGQAMNRAEGDAGRTDKMRPDLLHIFAAPGPELASEQELSPESQQGEGDRPEEGARREDKARIAQVLTMEAILHEAAHSADYLLQRYGSDDYNLMEKGLMTAPRWDAASERMAEEIVERNRLEKGLLQEWWRIQGAFFEFGRAADYHGQGRQVTLTPDAIVKGGFMSEYGGHQVADDIAEMTAWALVGDAMRYAVVDAVYGETPEGPVMDHACAILQSQPGPGIEIEYAAAYTKLGLLQTTGFISEEAYLRCVGNLKVRGSGQGFFTHRSDQPARSYTGDVNWKIGKRADSDGEILDSSPFVFEMTARGTAQVTSDGEVPVIVTLRLAVAGRDADLEDASFPRGLYSVGVDKPDNQLIIIRTDNDKTVMEVTHGLALVARGSADLVEGSLVVQKYLNYSGGLMSAIGGAEAPKEPTLITFRVRK